MSRVLVAGAGVAAVEMRARAARARGLACRVELLAPAAELVHRPSSVKTPFGGAPAARDRPPSAGPRPRDPRPPRRVESVDTETHQVLHPRRRHVAYDLLVVATGARSREAVPGRSPSAGPMSAGLVEQAIGASPRPVASLAFAAPAGVRWLFRSTSSRCSAPPRCVNAGVSEPDIVVATGEHEPLEVFGPAASEAIHRELDRAGMELVTSAAGRRAFDGALRLATANCCPPTSSSRCPRSSGRDTRPAARQRRLHPRRRARSRRGMQRRVRRRRRHALPDQARRPRRTAGRRGRRGDRGAGWAAIGMPEPFQPVLRGLLLTGDARSTSAPSSVPAASESIACSRPPAPGRTAHSGGRRARSPAGT